MARKPMDVQSVLVDASKYSLEEAKAKARKMGYKVTKVDKPKEGEKQRFYRFRQRDPGQFEKFVNQVLERKKKDGTTEKTGVVLVLAKSFHLLVKAVGHKYLKRVMTPTGYRYIYQEHPATKQADPKVEHTASPAVRGLASLIRRSHSAVGKHISAKAHDAVVAAKFHGKRRTKEHLDKIEQVYAEHRKKLGAAIEDARGKGKITHAEAMRLRKYQDKHGGSLANAIERLKGLMRDPKSALAQKSFSIAALDKAAGAGVRPHKYVKRVPRPGGGFRYVYAEPAAPKGEKREKPSSKLLAFEERAGFRVAQPLGWAAKEHGLTGAEKNELMQRFSQHMPHFKMTSNPEKNRARAAMIFNHWAEAAKMGRGRKDKFQRSVSQTANAEIGRLKGKKPEDYKKVADVYKKEAEHRTKKEDKAWHKEVGRIIEAHGQALSRGEKTTKEGKAGQSHGVWASAVAAQLGREIGLPEGSLWVPPAARRIEKLVASGKMTRKEALAETRFSLGLPKTKKQETKKSFTEENSMTDELSLAQREGERIAMEVLGSEEARAERMAKAVLEVPVHGKTKKKTIPDARLLAVFKAHVRTEYRNACRYNEGTNAQSIYDRVLSSAEYNHTVEAALGLLEKLKTPFSVDFVKQCIQEIEDAQKEAGNVAPEPTEPSSVVASGG